MMETVFFYILLRFVVFLFSEYRKGPGQEQNRWGSTQRAEDVTYSASTTKNSMNAIWSLCNSLNYLFEMLLSLFINQKWCYFLRLHFILWTSWERKWIKLRESSFLYSSVWGTAEHRPRTSRMVY